MLPKEPSSGNHATEMVGCTFRLLREPWLICYNDCPIIWTSKLQPQHVRSRTFQTVLPPNQLDVISDVGHLGCGFLHPAFLVQLHGNSQPAQMGFAIQVRKIEPSLVGIAENMLVATENMEEHNIQPPTSMVKDNKSITKPLHTPVVRNICQCFPSSY